MRACSSTSCQARHSTRRALIYSHLQSRVAQNESQGRRIAVLQCISASRCSATLAKLSSQTATPAHDAAAHLALALQRRSFLALAAAAAASLPQEWQNTARAEEAAVEAPAAPSPSPSPAPSPSLESAAALSDYANAKQRYRLQVPAAWDVKGKAGADVLFEDPARRSTSVGVTVNPVKVASIQQFGGLGDVGTRLLEAERRKESTLDVVLVASSSRVGASGATLYDYEYELDSTRGRKRILNTVTIFNSRLYILNAAYKCDKEACGQASEAGVQLLRRVAASFDVTAS